MKKLLSVILCFIMVLGILPGFAAVVFAAETDGNVITLYETDLEASAGGTGWNYDASVDRLTIESGYILVFEGSCDSEVYNNGTIKSGAFYDRVYNYGTIEGGNFDHQVKNSGEIKEGYFSGEFANQNGGIIDGGTFAC